MLYLPWFTFLPLRSSHIISVMTVEMAHATLLNSKGIAVRSGQHCAKILNGFLKTPATCRMSTYLYTTKEDIDALVNALKEGGNILDAYFN